MRRFSVGALLFLLGAGALLSAAAPRPPSEPVVPPTLLEGLRWRLVGPFRGGWSTMAVGVPDQPDTFYFGAAGGGVWKSTDAGQTWTPIFDGRPTAAVGALAVSPSDSRILYVGMGHPEPRYDIAAGNGLFKSADGGSTWQHVGLEGTGHIGDILIDPRNPNVVLVAALGHLFGENPERGVFRTADGGKTWSRTLFVDEKTGAVDLAVDPADPDRIYAATWQARGWPWLSYFTPMEGPGSGIYRSEDGGRSWKRLGGEGWPSGNLGRIGLAVTDVKGRPRIYASIVSATSGGLYRSDDGGGHWAKVHDAKAVATWYFSRLTVAPGDPDTLYTLGQSIHRSQDGGRTFTIVRGAPGGDDFHDLWINPRHPERMVTASDQGTLVTLNGGLSWSSWYNQPTGQFYHLAADDRVPYRIYSSQQDSGTVAVVSRGDYGALSFRDWHPVGGDERDHAIPDPADPDIVYSSGLGGRLSRWDARTGEVQNITPWPVNTYGERPTGVRYRYTWITPLAAAPGTPPAIYVGAQVLFRSTDQGRHWDVISPDLSGRQAGAKGCAGNLKPKAALACGYGVISTIAPAPGGGGEIWVGTDDGRVQVTRDGGKHWRNVTPPGLPRWGMVAAVERSPTVAGTAYVAVDNHRQDDFRPRIWRTRDYGASWTEIGSGLPADHYVNVVRADPVRPGLLYAGTESGVFVSFDDGGGWQSLQRNLPAATVRDLLVHGNDLIAATQGRAIWVLDDLSPLRQVNRSVLAEPAHLFTPSPAIRYRTNQNRDTPLPPETPLGENPPTGAVIDYWLNSPAGAPVVIEIHDRSGHPVRRFTGADPPEELPVDRYFTEDWLRPAAPPSGEAGGHRFVWNLRIPRPKAVKYSYSIAASRREGAPVVPWGPPVPPGEYRVVLEVDGRRSEAPLIVRPDPRVPPEEADPEAAFRFYAEVADALARTWDAHREVAAARARLEALRKDLESRPDSGPVRDSIRSLLGRLAPLTEEEGDAAPNLGALDGVLTGIAGDVEESDRPPTEAQRQVLTECRSRLEKGLALWREIRDRDVDSLNRRLTAAGWPAVDLRPSADAPEPPGESSNEW